MSETNGHITKQDLKEALEGVEERIAALIAESQRRVMERVDGRIDASEERMKDTIRKSIEAAETKLLAEFWKWGRTTDIRTREAIADTAATGTKAQMLSERLLNIEDRVSALERERRG